MNIENLQKKLEAFTIERDWVKFHNPKNLVMALSVECSELVEEFQWLNETESANIMNDPQKAKRVRNELADITAYLLLVADKLKVDLEKSLLEKMSDNAEKYPVEKFKGSSRKYNR